MSINELQQDLYRQNFLRIFGPSLGVRSVQPTDTRVSRDDFYRLMHEGSGILYQQQRESREKRGYLSRIGGYMKNAYEFVGKPYVGLGLLGGLLGGISGLVFGPLGALFSAAVVGGMGSAFGTSLYWGWTRGERKARNSKWLDGRSVGKYVADNWEGWFPRRQTQPQPV